MNEAKTDGWGDIAEEVKRLIRERDEAQARADKAEADFRFMVERAADQHLDGYRELGARAAAAENARDEALARAEKAINCHPTTEAEPCWACTTCLNKALDAKDRVIKAQQEELFALRQCRRERDEARARLEESEDRHQEFLALVRDALAKGGQ